MMMRLLANLVAIVAMGLFAYASLLALPAIFPIREIEAIWAAVVTALIGVWALYIWQPKEEGGMSASEWIRGLGWGWAASILFFVLACWLHDVPLSDALGFPPALWDDRQSYWHDHPFWLSMIAGPGATLLVVGSLVRLGVLRLLGLPPMTPAGAYVFHQKFERWQDWSGWLYYLVLPLLGFIVGTGAWLIYELLDKDRVMAMLYLAIWAPVSLTVLIGLHRFELMRIGFSLVVTVLLLVLLAWFP
jgi:hypothetical protein